MSEIIKTGFMAIERGQNTRFFFGAKEKFEFVVNEKLYLTLFLYNVRVYMLFRTSHSWNV